jgi:hypothetical protein
MTVFNTGNQTDVNPGEVTNPESFVERLVKAKGENWKDPEVMAKGKLEADARIEAYEVQIAELQKKVDNQDYAKELLESIRSQAPKAGEEKPGEPATTTSVAEENTTLDASQLEDLIKKTLTGMNTEKTTRTNLEVVNTRLDELYGTEANKTVESKAKELGVTLESLQEIAAKSPQAFFRLIGDEKFKTETNTVVPRTVNSDMESFTTSKDRDWNYYQKIRKENPKLYRSSDIQNQMLADKIRLGDKFGNP